MSATPAEFRSTMRLCGATFRYASGRSQAGSSPETSRIEVGIVTQNVMPAGAAVPPRARVLRDVVRAGAPDAL